MGPQTANLCSTVLYWRWYSYLCLSGEKKWNKQKKSLNMFWVNPTKMHISDTSDLVRKSGLFVGLKQYTTSAQAAISASDSDLSGKITYYCTSATSYFQLRNKRDWSIKLDFHISEKGKRERGDFKTKAPLNFVSCLRPQNHTRPELKSMFE